MFTLLVFFVGFSTDGGRAYLLKAELRRTIDAAAIAAASRISGGLSAAQNAACDSARMNGVVNCAALTVTEVTVNDAAGNPKESVKVTATVSTPTIFLRAGKLMGCGTICDAINVSASAVAATGGLVDLVMNLDDTASMAGANIAAAKNGANALADALVPATDTSAAAKMAMVPFRGCYNSDASNGCKDSGEAPSSGSIASLPSGSTNNNVIVHNAINALNGNGGSGTNVCEGLSMARQKLFQAPGTRSRDNAQKFIVLLTDAEFNYDKTASFVAPVNCNPDSGDSNSQHRTLAVRTNDLATAIKTGVSGGGQTGGVTVTIFVILYGSGAQSGVTTYAGCGSLSTETPDGNARYMKTLAQCMASSPGELYLAPSASDINAAFQQIISRLPVLLIN
jgi:hypothetical protein